MSRHKHRIVAFACASLVAFTLAGAARAADRDDLVREIDALETQLGMMIVRDPGAWAAAAASLGGVGVAIDDTLPDEVRVIAGLVGVIAGIACLNDPDCRSVVADMVETGRQLDGAKAALAQLDASGPTPAPSVAQPVAVAAAPEAAVTPTALSTAVWRPLPEHIAADTRSVLEATLAERSWQPGTIGRATALHLPFYEAGWLIRFEAETSDGLTGWYDIVVAGSRTHVVDGTSPGIHELNLRAPLSITTPEAAATYLRFFTESIAAADGPFVIIDTIADMPWAPSAPANVIVDTQTRIVPFSVAPSGDGWSAVATVQYGRGIFRAGFRIAPDGTVEMTDDQQIAGDLPLVQSVYHQGLRTVRTLD